MPTSALYHLGLLLIALLFPLYLGFAEQWLPAAWIQDPLGLVLVFFLTAVAYLVATTTQHVQQHGWKRLHRSDERLYPVALVLFSLSAHALNLTEIRVFEPYVGWMKGYVWLLHGAILAFPHRHRLPDWGQYLLYAINGAGLVLTVYLTLFLGPLILWAIPLAIALGLSLHATVPVWLGLRLAASYRQMGDLPYARRAYWTGVMIPLLVLAIFLQQWQTTQEQISQPQALASPDLPTWVQVAQRLPDHGLTEQVLLNQGINQRSFWGGDWGTGVLGLGARREFRRHDPLGVIAHHLYGALPLDKEDLARVLETRYDARHMTHRRLWRGDDLATSYVGSTIDLYPRHRLAYQAMTLRVRNLNKKRRGNQQEAVYSFHLPPGAVATSLSLWVEGEARPSVLTTRAQADSAYETIVGRERRDPALLHWQEGNRVTITIFPCTPDEERQVRIGFTVPMQYQDGDLILPPVPFDGPATWLAEQALDVHLHGLAEAEDLRLPLYWTQQSATHWQHRGRYQPDWQLKLAAPPLSEGAFDWQGHGYRLAAAQPTREAWRPQRIYLDVNAAWTPWALRQVREMLTAYEVYVFAPQPVRLTAANCDRLLDQLRAQRFSLPPLYHIADPARSLVVSASDGNTPLLSDLDGTTYGSRMGQWLAGLEQPLRWVSLSEDLAPFVRTLSDLRVINLHRCERGELEAWLANGEFPRLLDGPQQVYVPSADVLIQREPATRSTGDALNDAPDHVYRLFAYQRLLQDIGRHFYDRSALEARWLRQAEAAFVVSPVSSLLVLETDEDYARFDIDPNADTLGNAIAQGAGATPEPHEWVLIALMGLALLGWGRRMRNG